MISEPELVASPGVYHYPVIITILVLAATIEVLVTFSILKHDFPKRQLLLMLIGVNAVTIPCANWWAHQVGYWAEVLPFTVEVPWLCLMLAITSFSKAGKVTVGVFTGNIYSWFFGWGLVLAADKVGCPVWTLQ